MTEEVVKWQQTLRRTKIGRIEQLQLDIIETDNGAGIHADAASHFAELLMIIVKKTRYEEIVKEIIQDLCPDYFNFDDI